MAIAAHGGRRPGAGRPKGAKDRATVERDHLAEARREGVARAVSALPFDGFLRLSADDVLRLSMLVALRDGDLAAAAEHAKRVQPRWSAELVSLDAGNPRRAEVACVDRVLERLARREELEGEDRTPVFYAAERLDELADELLAGELLGQVG